MQTKSEIWITAFAGMTGGIIKYMNRISNFSFVIFVLFMVYSFILHTQPLKLPSESQPFKLPPTFEELEASASLQKGVDAYNAGRFKEAVKIFEQYLKVNPYSSIVKYALGATYLELGKYYQAEMVLIEASRDPIVNENPEILLALAKVRLMMKKYDTALQPLEKYIQIQPDNVEAVSTLGALYFNLDKFDKAELYLEKAVQSNPNSAEAWFQYAMTLYKNNKYSEALKSLKKVKELSPSNKEIDYYIGVLAYQEKDFKTAQEVFEAMIKKGTATFEVYTVLGSIAGIDKNYKKAEEHFLKALKMKPDDKQLLYNLALCEINLDKKDQAVNRLKNALKKWKNDSELTYALAVVYAKLERYNDAIDLLEKFVKKYPNKSESIRLLASLYEQKSDYDKAISTLRAYFKQKPKDIEAHESLAKILKKAERKEDALKEYEVIQKIAPNNEEAFRQAGLLLEELKQIQRAEETYKKMAKAFPDSSFPLSHLGFIAESHNDNKTAAYWFDAALKKKNMEELGVYTRRAKSLEAEGKKVEAELLYRQGLEKMFEHSQQLYMDLMTSIQESGGTLDFNKLMEISEKEKGFEIDLNSAIEGVHKSFVGRGDSQGELDYFNKLMEKYKSNKKLVSYVAGLLKEKGDVDEVLKLCDTWLKLDVKDVEGHLMMAWAYEQKSDVKEASLAYKRAVEADSSKEEAWNGLVKTYKTQNRQSELIPYIEKKLEDDPKNELLEKILQELKSEQPSGK